MPTNVIINNPTGVFEEETQIAVAPLAGDSSITVISSVGFHTGDYMVIGTPGEEKTELIMSDEPTDAVTIPLQSPLHQPAMSVVKL